MAAAGPPRTLRHEDVQVYWSTVRGGGRRGGQRWSPHRIVPGVGRTLWEARLVPVRVRSIAKHINEGYGTGNSRSRVP